MYCYRNDFHNTSYTTRPAPRRKSGPPPTGAGERRNTTTYRAKCPGRMMMYTYRNEFHNTEVSRVKSPAQVAAIKERLATGKATDADKAFARRMHRQLCGQSDCTCGDVLGCRPAVRVDD